MAQHAAKQKAKVTICNNGKVFLTALDENPP